MIIGITGSIGSGKTTVAKLFSKHWYNRIDADEIGHEILKKNSIAYKKTLKEKTRQYCFQQSSKIKEIKFNNPSNNYQKNKKSNKKNKTKMRR